MDNLFFRLQENKQFQRQILILQYLNKKDHPSTSKELSNVTKTSSPTLRSDIEALRQILPKEMAITFQKRIGYQLMVPRSPKIETIILDLAKHTPVFQLIDQYFRGRIRSLQSAAATLYSSQSRIRKIIKQLNKELQTYHLQWQTSPMKIQGSEADIRCFLFDFYQSFNIDFTAEGIPVDSNFMKFVQKLIGLPIDPLKAQLWLIILTKRLSHKYPIVLDLALKEDITFRESFTQFKKRVRYLFKATFRTQTIPHEELIWLYIVFLNCVVYSSDADQFCYPEDREHYDTYHQFFLPMIPSVENTDELYAFSVNLRLLSHVSSHYQKNPLKDSFDLPLHLKKLYEDWYIYLKTPNVQQFFPILHPEHVALSFTMFHYSLLKAANTTQIKVFFSFHGNAGLSSYLLKLVEQIIPRSIQPLFATGTHAYRKDLPSDVSLIVCNHLWEDWKNCPVFTLSSLPQEKEWLDLHQLLLNLSAFN